MIYWDTSAVLKLYVAESDSDLWTRHALASSDDFAASALLEAELGYGLIRKEAEGSIRRGAAEVLLDLFRKDVERTRFTLFPIGGDILRTAVLLAARCAQAGRPGTLRTLDGIHLATATALRCSAVATADRRMREGAAILGLPLL